MADEFIAKKKILPLTNPNSFINHGLILPHNTSRDIFNQVILENKTKDKSLYKHFPNLDPSFSTSTSDLTNNNQVLNDTKKKYPLSRKEMLSKERMRLLDLDLDKPKNYNYLTSSLNNSLNSPLLGLPTAISSITPSKNIPITVFPSHTPSPVSSTPRPRSPPKKTIETSLYTSKTDSTSITSNSNSASAPSSAPSSVPSSASVSTSASSDTTSASTSTSSSLSSSVSSSTVSSFFQTDEPVSIARINVPPRQNTINVEIIICHTLYTQDIINDTTSSSTDTSRLVVDLTMNLTQNLNDSLNVLKKMNLIENSQTELSFFKVDASKLIELDTKTTIKDLDLKNTDRIFLLHSKKKKKLDYITFYNNLYQNTIDNYKKTDEILISIQYKVVHKVMRETEDTIKQEKEKDSHDSSKDQTKESDQDSNKDITKDTNKDSSKDSNKDASYKCVHETYTLYILTNKYQKCKYMLEDVRLYWKKKNLRLKFNGIEIMPEHTFDELEIKDGSIIYAVIKKNKDK